MLGLSKSLGIDIGDDAIRIVELSTKYRGFQVQHAAYVSLPEDRSPAGLAQALATITREAHTPVAIALPASGCAFKTSLLPPAKVADLAEVVKFEASSLFPLPLSELSWGYALTPESTGRMHAALVGARRTLVEDRLALLQQLGQTPTALLVAPLAAAGAIPHPDGHYLVVVAGAEWSDLCLFEDGHLQGCRSINAGSPYAEGWTERLAREIRPWTAHVPLSRVLLLGRVTGETASALSRVLDVSVTLGDPWADVRNAQDCLAELDEPPAAYATAIGLAKTALGRQSGINLLPQQLVEARTQRKKLALALTGLILAAALLTPSTLSGMRTLHHTQATLQRVQKDVRVARKAIPASQGAGLVSAKLVTSSLEKPESTPLELLRALSEGAPAGLLLSSMSFDRGRTAVLKGRAPSEEALTEMMTIVSETKGVERAMLDYSNMITDDFGQWHEFQITCTLPPTSDPTSAQTRGRAKSQTGTVVAR